MNDDILRLQLRALRATLVSAVSQLEALEGALPDPPAPEALPCAHKHRKSYATADCPGRFQCGDCGEIVEPPTEAKEE